MLGEWFALTLTQNDIYLDQLKHQGNPLYNVGGYIDLRDIDMDRLKEAHYRLVSREEIFGLRIVTTPENGAGQCIEAARSIDLPIMDLSREIDPPGCAQRWLRTFMETPVAVEIGPLFKAQLIKLSANRYWYVGLAHHIAMDGWGFSNWASSLADLYNDSSASDAPSPAWKAIVEDDIGYVASSKFSADRTYWRERVGEAQSLLGVRYPRANSSDRKAVSRRRTISIGRQKFNALASVARAMEAGVSQLFLGLLSVYFHRVSNERKILIGVPFHNRRKPAYKRMLGVFMGMSVLRLDIPDDERTFGEYVKSIGRQQLSDLRHQRYPLGGIVRDLGLAGQQRTPFDVAFNYLRLGGAMRFGEGQGELVYISHNHEPLPLMVTLCEYGDAGEVELQLDYNLDCISEEDAGWLQDRLAFLVDALPKMSALKLSDIEVLPPAECQRLLDGFGDPPLSQESGGCLHHLFERQARMTPEAIAVDDGLRTLTYKKLDSQANRMAQSLIDRGIKSETLVGVCLERNAELLVTVLAVLKAGGAYVPLDSTYPPQRLTTLVEDSATRMVIAQEQHAHLFASLGVDVLSFGKDPDPTPRLEHGPGADVAPHHMAYVIYTSGSTGKPKGVQIPHAAAVALLDWVRTVYAPEDLAMTLASTSLNFDLSVFELFAPLMTGGCCVLVKDILTLIDHPRAVTLINTVPSAMKAVLDRGALPSGLRIVNLAGEPLPMPLVNSLLATGQCEKVINLYGPSEDTTYSTYAIFQDVLTEPPIIGRAIAGTRLYVLDAKMRLSPFGAIGELHIAGNGLARGYLRAPELTAEKFLANGFPAKRNERVYRTGDYVRYNLSGELEYVGRLDEQVKIRGFRIELGEIRQCIERCKDVKSAAVLVQEREDGDKLLAAYVERQEGLAKGMDDDAWLETLKSFVRTNLPAHMVPSEFILMTAMPLTSNGKIDKKQLQSRPVDRARKPHQPPQTETEIRLSKLWSSLLGVDHGAMGRDTGLYEFGGHSLLIVRLVSAIRSEFGAPLSVQAAFDSINLAELSKKIDISLLLKHDNEGLGSAQIISDGYL